MRKASTLRYTTLWVLLIWAFISVLTNAVFAIYVQATYSKYTRVPFTTYPYSLVINGLLPGYENCGLAIGDEITALNGERVRGHEQTDRLRFQQSPGDTVMVAVRRRSGTQEQHLDVPVRLHRNHNNWARTVAVSVLIPIFCVVVGFYIVLARPNDRLAWIAMAMLASVGQAATGAMDWAIYPPWRQLTFAYSEILNSSWPFFMVLFALYFPKPFGWLKRVEKWFISLLALPFVIFAALSLYGDFMVGNHTAEIGWLANLFRKILPSVDVLFTVYVFGFFYLLACKKQSSPTSDARRRLNVMITGCSIALIPLLPVVFLDLPVWLSTACLMMLVFFPLTMAYVIVVQRAMDVRMVVRSGVRYAVASNGLKILRISLIIYVATLIASFERHSETRMQGILVGVIGAAAIIMVGRIMRALSAWMDRRFFREAYNAELILTDLSNIVAGMRDSKTVVQTVAQRISESLHVDRIAVLLRRGSLFQPAYALGFSSSIPAVHLEPDAVTVRTLKSLREPSRVYFDDPQSWVQATPQTERAVLERLDTHVLLPLTLKNRFLGLISLGAKRSEAPYSRADLQLLGAVASQTGLALENAELTETIRREIAQRERLDRELEIAREVQQRLFPQRLPELPGLDIAGYCRPAQVVGGDYYDFIELPESCLGVAVGDVSGKGIGPALMMASLQASLRAHTRKRTDALPEMIEDINRLLFEASSENRYATFFYGEYHAASRCLHYVNAGHNPPMILRVNSATGEVTRLEEGGTVLGLFPDAVYHEGTTRLQPGDVFVGYTDGITEAMTKQDEEFGEERLIQAIRRCASRPAAEMITCIFEETDAFTAGARQHDDMTLTVVRFNDQ
ncbi:MAG: SpoIIE family protein phosphatase [Acidobacteriaceae bacterium]|nr:SpoIIE family protein phosphatase [Acidobacteriaceae bacterium]MBV8569690.1 SpoIIE family protein phosphatase [Acidobacteriaceae bacterium]